ncbi:MAG: TOBE domain-containing protein, partial [Thermoleophilaceae bacterium]
TPDEVYRHPANLFVAQFIGSPPMNLLDAERHGDWLVAAGVWRLPLPRLSRAGDASTLRVGLRPEDIRIALGPSDGAVRGEVLVSEPLGSEVIVNVTLAGCLLKVRAAPDVRPDPGVAVYVAADAAAVRVFDASTGAALN